MTTVLSVYNNSGCVGRCDATCHEAKGPKCTCICGGKNHGAGYIKAVTNTADMIGLREEDLLGYATATKRDPAELTVINRLEYKSAKEARRRALYRLTEPELFDWKGDEV